MGISNWSSDVGSSDLAEPEIARAQGAEPTRRRLDAADRRAFVVVGRHAGDQPGVRHRDKGIGGAVTDLKDQDRQSVVYGKRVPVRVDPGGRRIKKKQKDVYKIQSHIPHEKEQI